MFTKVRQVRAFESVIQQVESAILQGRYAAGDRLPAERELQGLLDVSRNTLRESLRVLEQKGLVEIRKGNRGGIFVKEPNADSMTESLGFFVQSQRISMEQISEFRQDLEGLVTRRAALAASAGDTGEVRAAAGRGRALRRGGRRLLGGVHADRPRHPPGAGAPGRQPPAPLFPGNGAHQLPPLPHHDVPAPHRGHHPPDAERAGRHRRGRLPRAGGAGRAARARARAPRHGHHATGRPLRGPPPASKSKTRPRRPAAPATGEQP